MWIENLCSQMQQYNPKKLIETALPLESINEAGAREKSIRHGHPSTLHLWWSRKPLAVARAVIFAQMVDDPSEYIDVLLSDSRKKRSAIAEMKRRKSKDLDGSSNDISMSDQQLLEEIIAEQERERLFDLIKELVKWENTNNARLLEEANAEIWKSWRRACTQNADHPHAAELFDRNKLPAFHDPFAGGGTIPLEAQRLGLEAYASDLNPVAVLINKAMIEIPPMFTDQPPVNLESQSSQTVVLRSWTGAQGLADDVRYYGEWMRKEAYKRIGHLYPKVEITEDMAIDRPDLEPYIGQNLTVIAWLWARTVKSPNPAFRDVHVPLAYTFMLSTKRGKEAYVEPVISGNEYEFIVKIGAPPDLDRAKRGTKLSRGANFECLLSGVPINGDYIKQESVSGRMNSCLMAIVAEGKQGRVYISPLKQHYAISRMEEPAWKPTQEMSRDTTNLVSGRGYGFYSWADLFTSRQLVALTTFSDLVSEAIDLIKSDALSAGMINEQVPLCKGGKGSTAYAQAVGLYLSFAISKIANTGSTIASWMNDRGALRETFARQAIPMVWSFAEANPFSNSGGNLMNAIRKSKMVIESLPSSGKGKCSQADATTQLLSTQKIISTDPPYYDNIGYADLSDFFYVWLRYTMKSTFQSLFSTVAVPKSDELVASISRHGNRKVAEIFFLDGMIKAMKQLRIQAHPNFPVTIYYAFKQSEKKVNSTTISTGWETFLESIIKAGFSITGTLPMRTEGTGRINAIGSNALASSIILVCHSKASGAMVISKREFLSTLKEELPSAITLLKSGNIAPVDLAQAAIGPGMKVYTRYAWLYILQIINPIFILRLLMSVFDLQSMIISRSSLRYLD